MYFFSKHALRDLNCCKPIFNILFSPTCDFICWHFIIIRKYLVLILTQSLVCILALSVYAVREEILPHGSSNMMWQDITVLVDGNGLTFACREFNVNLLTWSCLMAPGVILPHYTEG
jgi:hypothetical protein